MQKGVVLLEILIVNNLGRSFLLPGLDTALSQGAKEATYPHPLWLNTHMLFTGQILLSQKIGSLNVTQINNNLQVRAISNLSNLKMLLYSLTLADDWLDVYSNRLEFCIQLTVDK